jgi:hypothetical protein
MIRIINAIVLIIRNCVEQQHKCNTNAYYHSLKRVMHTGEQAELKQAHRQVRTPSTLSPSTATPSSVPAAAYPTSGAVSGVVGSSSLDATGTRGRSAQVPYTPHPHPTSYTLNSLHPAPYALRPAPHTLHPASYTPHSHPTSYAPHPTSYTPHSTPYILHPTPYTLHLTPYTLHPTPYILQPASYTPHPTSYSPHPAPYIPHPKPETRNPKPETRNLRTAASGGFGFGDLVSRVLGFRVWAGGTQTLRQRALQHSALFWLRSPIDLRFGGLAGGSVRIRALLRQREGQREVIQRGCSGLRGRRSLGIEVKSESLWVRGRGEGERGGREGGRV